jgi:probable HAF family extracellular repeat protein
MIALAGGSRPASAAPGIVGLGDLPGGAFDSEATDVSDDGKVVVGQGVTATAQREAFRWTAETGMVGLGIVRTGAPPFATYSYGWGVSGDGQVTVGLTAMNPPVGNSAFRHTPSGGMVPLSQLPGGTDAEARGVSFDGSVIVGHGNFVTGTTGGRQSFRWTSSTGVVGIANLPGENAIALGLSKDGVVAVGVTAASIGSTPSQAFRHTLAEGIVGLGDLPGGTTSAMAFAASANGSVIVGGGTSASGPEAFRWTQGGGMAGLGDLPGGAFNSNARDVTDDGLTIVGRGSDAGGFEAFYWTAGGGMQSLTSVLTAAGADPALSGWTELTEATGVSGDGLYVAGYGIHNGNREAFIATVPEPASLAPLAVAGAAVLSRRRRRAS